MRNNTNSQNPDYYIIRCPHCQIPHVNYEGVPGHISLAFCSYCGEEADAQEFILPAYPGALSIWDEHQMHALERIELEHNGTHYEIVMHVIPTGDMAYTMLASDEQRIP